MFIQSLDHRLSNDCSHSYRHCADAVVSFADNSNVVGELATGVVDITSRWIRSGTKDFDVIIASTVSADWALAHKPVISTATGHVLYTGARLSEPDGRLVLCHKRCGALLHLERNSNSTSIKFTCTRCQSTCTIKTVKAKKNTRLNRKGLVKASYPQEQYPTQWMLPQAEAAPEQEQAKVSLDLVGTSNAEGLRPTKALPSRGLRRGPAVHRGDVSPAISQSSETSLSRPSSASRPHTPALIDRSSSTSGHHTLAPINRPSSTSRPHTPAPINRSSSLPVMKSSRSALTIKLPPSISSTASTSVTPPPPPVGPSNPPEAGSPRRRQSQRRKFK